MEKFNNIGHVLLFILLFLWQLPQNIIALVMMPFLGKLKLISYKNFCFAFEGENMSGGISLGTFAFVSTYNAKKPLVIKHEQEGHTFDSKIFGPLYLLVIGLPSILWAWLGDDNKCYYDFYTEKWANNHAGLEALKTTNGRCVLTLKNVLGSKR